MNDSAAGNWIMYDGECPFCQNFIKYIRLRDSIGPVRLIDARADGPERRAVAAAGFDIDKGMAMQYEGRLYHGPACVNRIALLSTRSGLFNSVAAWAFESEGRAKIIYPVLKGMRDLTLKILGRGGINGPL